MTDINRELAEDAAEDYSDDPIARHWFILGWLSFCNGDAYLMGESRNPFTDGYIAARDAPDY